jgi:hypothetical protein
LGSELDPVGVSVAESWWCFLPDDIRAYSDCNCAMVRFDVQIRFCVGI